MQSFLMHHFFIKNFTLALALALASLYIDNTKPICYNIAKKNSHVVLISVSEVFIWQTAKTETSLLTALWAL